MAGKKFLTVAEAAEYFEVQPATIREWCRSGKLKAIRPGRDWKIHRDNIQELAQQLYGE